MKRLSPFVLVFVSLVACDRNHKADQTQAFRYRFSIDEIVNSKLPPAEAAEKIAKGAEQLMNAKGFDQSATAAEAALKLDPKNFRAAFVQAIVKTIQFQKGLMVRTRLLADRSPVLKKQWDARMDGIRENPDAGINRYLVDGTKSDINNEADAQKFMDQGLVELERLRQFLTAHRNAEITMIASSLFVPDATDRWVYRCEIKEAPGRSYEMVCPPSIQRRQVSLNRADFEYILGGVIYHQLYFGYINSYDLDGTLEVIKDRQEIVPTDHQLIADRLMTRPEFGALRANNTLAGARAKALDYVAGFNWASANPHLTCPKGGNDPLNRPGFFLNTGFCFTAQMKRLPLANKVVTTKGVVAVEWDQKAGPATFNNDLFAPFERPVPTLKVLLPVKFNECGKAIEVADKTLGGAFPDGNADAFFKGDASCKKDE